MLAGAGDGDGDVERRADDLARQADLLRDRPPVQVTDRAAGADGCAQLAGQLLNDIEVLWAAHPASGGDDDVRVLQPDALCGHALPICHFHPDGAVVDRDVDVRRLALARGVGLGGLLRLRAHGHDLGIGLDHVDGLRAATVAGARAM